MFKIARKLFFFNETSKYKKKQNFIDKLNPNFIRKKNCNGKLK